MQLDPIAFQIGPVTVYWYGLLIATGALVGAWLASLEAERRGWDPDHIWNALVVCLILGLIGARLYHVISSPAGGAQGWDYYRQNPIDIIRFWRDGQLTGISGLGIYGAVVGGLLGLLAYTYFAGLKFLDWADLGMMGLAMGQVIGRWGNFFNQELYGNPTSLPWGIPIDAAHRLPQFRDLPADARFHPSFLYESLWNLLVVGALLYLTRRFEGRLRSGDLLLSYLILYPIGRFLVEFQRPDAWTVRGIPAAQIIAVVSIVVSAGVLIYRHRFAESPSLAEDTSATQQAG
ncbi:MAG: Prolipoprotein diacylglyceryl transferase [Anaerolineales bacterium]|nr:Prolipoprotein diacylglyceryl transferase [Anaerolineales bacterium]